VSAKRLSGYNRGVEAIKAFDLNVTNLYICALFLKPARWMVT
jgi:hypothetical protein